MKINNIGRLNVNPYTKQAERQEKLAKTEKRDQIQISSEALELQKGSGIEKARQEKVNALKNQISSGQYEVNPREVAKKMYGFWNNEG